MDGTDFPQRDESPTSITTNCKFILFSSAKRKHLNCISLEVALPFILQKKYKISTLVIYLFSQTYHFLERNRKNVYPYQ
jgi:hypothetical protein